MRTIRISLVCAFMLVMIAARPAVAQSSTAIPQDYDPNFNYDCDRACLDSYVDQYLAALVAHDPSRLPLARQVKFTENGQQLQLGDGLWGTASGIGNYKIYADDPQAGEVMFMGTHARKMARRSSSICA